jgi:TRAP-type C4-dicarboxylate transport system permease small subunit
MALIEIKKDPSPRELRIFGALLLLLFALIAGVVYWRTSDRLLAGGIAAGGTVLGAVYWVAPPLRRPIYLGWTYAAFPIGWCVSALALAVAYYAVLTPVGLLLRLVGHDPMRRGRRAAAKSYWIRREANRPPPSYFRQY